MGKVNNKNKAEAVCLVSSSWACTKLPYGKTPNRFKVSLPVMPIEGPKQVCKGKGR